ncbi:MAG: hypothetical protein ACLSGB_16155 [Dorea sp.]
MSDFLEENELPLLGDIPRDNLIQRCEKKSQTVLEGAKESEVARKCLDILQRR